MKFYFFTALLFSFFRGINFLSYRQKAYPDLEITDILLSFVHGVKFDLSIIFTLYGLPTLVLFIPWRWESVSKFAARVSIALLVLAASLILFSLISDFFYFKQVNRHVFDELIVVAGEWDFVKATVAGSYLWYVLAYLVFSCVTAFILYRYLWRSFDRRRSWTSLILFLLASVLIIRGGFGLKPLGIIDAFTYGGSQGGQLALNGVFSGWHASRNSKAISYPKLNSQHFKELAETLELGRDGNPFLRNFDGHASKPNVIIILLESWASLYIEDPKNQNIFKNLSELREQGVYFKNFYATGSRSIEAIQSILTSFPSLKGLPTLGLGFELLNTAELGSMAKRSGYLSYFFQAARRESFRLNSVADAYGFDEYFGFEDYVEKKFPELPIPAFGWDFDMYRHAQKVFDQAQRPFVSFMFTGTTHTPFVPMKGFDFFNEAGPENEFGFLNSLHYADWSLGEFINSSREKEWFDNTIFMITADHSLQTYRKFTFDQSFRVPMLIYSPKHFQGEIREEISGHLDILPTVAEFVGSEKRVSMAGRSLMRKNKYNYAFLSQRYANPAWLDDQGVVVSDLSRVIDKPKESRCNEDCVQKKFEWLQSLNAFLYEAIRENSWQKEPTGKSQ